MCTFFSTQEGKIIKNIYYHVLKSSPIQVNIFSIFFINISSFVRINVPLGARCDFSFLISLSGFSHHSFHSLFVWKFIYWQLFLWWDARISSVFKYRCRGVRDGLRRLEIEIYELRDVSSSQFFEEAIFFNWISFGKSAFQLNDQFYCFSNFIDSQRPLENFLKVQTKLWEQKL